MDTTGLYQQQQILKITREQQRKKAARFAEIFLPILNAKMKRFEEVLHVLGEGGTDINEEERMVLAKVKLAIAKFKLGRNECIIQIETRPPDTLKEIILHDIHFLMAAAAGADYLTISRIHGCLLQLANNDAKIIKSAASHAIKEINSN